MRLGPLMTGPGVSGWSTFVIAGILSVVLGFAVLGLSGALFQLGDAFGRGVLVLTLFLIVPGASATGWGVHLHSRAPVQDLDPPGSRTE